MDDQKSNLDDAEQIHGPTVQPPIPPPIVPQIPLHYPMLFNPSITRLMSPIVPYPVPFPGSYPLVGFPYAPFPWPLAPTLPALQIPKTTSNTEANQTKTKSESSDKCYDGKYSPSSSKYRQNGENRCSSRDGYKSSRSYSYESRNRDERSDSSARKRHYDQFDKPSKRIKIEEMMEQIRKSSIVRYSPLEPYFKHYDNGVVEATEPMINLRSQFEETVFERAKFMRSLKPAFSFPKRPIKLRPHKHHGLY